MICFDLREDVYLCQILCVRREDVYVRLCVRIRELLCKLNVDIILMIDNRYVLFN
jgi:hypothetical protein